MQDRILQKNIKYLSVVVFCEPTHFCLCISKMQVKDAFVSVENKMADSGCEIPVN